jgi:hypothetical protein
MKGVKFKGDISYRLQELAREEMKEKLLNDIMIDMNICKLEGWDVMKYLLELQSLITDIITRKKIT